MAGLNDDNIDEEALAEKGLDKAEGEQGKMAKRGNGFPKLLMSEPGRQAFWFVILALSLVSCQAGLAFSFLGATLRPALENHDVMMNHYGQIQATLNVGKAGSFIVVVGLMMVKGSAFQLVAALMARQKRKSRRRCALKLAFGCVLFEVVFIILTCVATTLLALWLSAFHRSYRETFPKAVLTGYLRNASITSYINWLQLRFQCCGVTDYKDWFIADWQEKQWLVNRYPTVPYYRDKFYASAPKVERYPKWREMSLMSNYERSSATRLAYLLDRYKQLVGDSLIDEYVAMTSFAEVPFSCCRLDAATTWCRRQYLVFKSHGYDINSNATIFRRGCPKQVQEYIDRQLTGLGVALLVLIVLRLLNLVLLRLVQTSTFNALVARRHLSPAPGWLITTSRAKAVTPSAEEQHLLEEELLSDLDSEEGSPSDDPDGESTDEVEQDDATRSEEGGGSVDGAETNTDPETDSLTSEVTQSSDGEITEVTTESSALPPTEASEPAP